MTTLSTRPIQNIGVDEPRGIKPDDHELYDFDISSQADSEEEEEEDYITTDRDTETSSEISEVDEMPVFIFKKRFEKPKKTYTIVLQEEDFLPE